MLQKEKMINILILVSIPKVNQLQVKKHKVNTNLFQKNYKNSEIKKLNSKNGINLQPPKRTQWPTTKKKQPKIWQTKFFETTQI